MKKLLIYLVTILISLSLSGCSLSSLPLPWKKNEPASTPSTSSSQSNGTASIPLNQRAISSVKKTPQNIDFENIANVFLNSWQSGDYQPLINDPLWKNHIKEQYSSNIEFKLYWDKVKKNVQQANIDLFKDQPSLVVMPLDAEALIEATLNNWLTVQFQLKKDNGSWQIKEVTYYQTNTTEVWSKNNSFYISIKPLLYSYNKLTEWSQWAFSQDEPSDLKKYVSDVTYLQGQIGSLNGPPEAKDLKTAWDASLKALNAALQEKLTEKGPETIMAETNKLVDQINQAENMKEPLTDKLEDASNVDEDLAENNLENAQNKLEQKLQELQLNSAPSSGNLDSLRNTWNDLDDQFNTSLDNYSQLYNSD